MMKKIILCIFMLFLGVALNAQNNQQPCTAAEASQFDFWVGNWNLYSADTLTGTNTIYKVMNGCAVQENFEGNKTGYAGKSWSMYNPGMKRWEQTWIDNQGVFIYLAGSFENNVMTLTTLPKRNKNGKEIINRMRFHDIRKDSFEWDWESTSDNGLTWVNGWHITYKRK